MSFCLYFWKCTKKAISCQKHHFGCVLWLLTLFVHFQNIDQNNMCGSVVFKAKADIFFSQKYYLTAKKPVYEFWNKNLKTIFSLITIDAQMLF